MIYTSQDQNLFLFLPHIATYTTNSEEVNATNLGC